MAKSIADQLQELSTALDAATAKASGTTYPDADALAAMSDKDFVAAATEAIAAKKDTPGARAALTKYRQRLAAETKRRVAASAASAE